MPLDERIATGVLAGLIGLGLPALIAVALL